MARSMHFFDIARIARFSLGRSWRVLDTNAQETFTNLLGEHIVATYADRFAQFEGQKFDTLGSQTAKGGVVVRTAITPADGAKVKLDYFFREGKVFNVSADGVSDLSLRRADYNSVLKASGFAALVEHLERKLKEIRLEESQQGTRAGQVTQSGKEQR